MGVREDNAEVERIAGLCLDHLVESPEELARFMDFVGYSPTSLRSALGSGALNIGLIDYFAANEPLLLSLCANTSLTAEVFMRAWSHANPQQ